MFTRAGPSFWGAAAAAARALFGFGQSVSNGSAAINLNRTADGTTWSTFAIGSGPPTLVAGADSGTRQIALGASSSGAYSDNNGASWTALTSLSTSGINSLAVGNGVWVASGSNSVYTSSNNGLTWASQTVPGTAGGLRGIGWTGTRWVCCNNGGAAPAVFYSTDNCGSWNALGNIIPSIGGGSGSFANGFVIYGGAFYAFGSENGIVNASYNVVWKSTDNGSTWAAVLASSTTQSISITRMSSDATGGLCGVGSDNAGRRSFSSIDGSSWTASSLFSNTSANGIPIGVGYTNGKWVVLSDGTGLSGSGSWWASGPAPVSSWTSVGGIDQGGVWFGLA